MPSPAIPNVPAGDSDATLSLYVADQYVVRRLGIAAAVLLAAIEGHQE